VNTLEPVHIHVTDGSIMEKNAPKWNDFFVGYEIEIKDEVK
jgi:hypothetical protein